MLTKKHIILFLLLLFIGCETIPGYKFSHRDSPSDAQARILMDTAVALENSGKYHKAALEYISVANQFSDSKYYKKAIQKTVLLNTHPENKTADLKTAIHWLKKYLQLPLTPEEKESEELRLALLEKTTCLQAKLSRITAEKISLKTVKSKQSGKLAEAEHQVKDLETKLAQARIQLEEMKEVDLRMHTRRVNGSGNNPITHANRNPILYPEAYSLETRNNANLKSPETTPGGLTNNHLKIVTTSQNQEDIASLSQEKNLKISSAADTKHKTKTRSYYPYTVQVGSFPCKETSVFEATKSREYGDNGFTSKVILSGRGTWYRVFIGVYQTKEEASKMALNLKTHDYPDAFAVKLPYAIRIEGVLSDQKQKKMEQDLRAKGYLAYHVSDVSYDEKEILIGAFRTADESERCSNSLIKDGFPACVVTR